MTFRLDRMINELDDRPVPALKIFSASLRRAALVLGFLALAACSASRPPPLPQIALDRLPEGALGSQSAAGNPQIRKDLAQAMALRTGRLTAGQSLTMLALSGGGANGAFGAGLMRGWSARGDRPEFDIITGISTGALMAPLVFLGPAWDETLGRLYTNSQASRIYKDRPLANVLRELSLKDPGPLRNLIRELINDDFAAAIAAEHRKGRRLYVGTTDLDRQRTVIWDLGAIASSNSPDTVPRLRDILLASSSVPLVFPPVYFPVVHENRIYQQMHVDGGIESPLLIPGLLVDVDGALREMGGERPRLHLFALVNQQIEVEYLQAVEPDMVAISVATINHSQRSNLASNLARISLLARSIGARFNVQAIPPGVRLEKDSLEFDQDEMKLLYRLGSQIGLSPLTWN